MKGKISYIDQNHFLHQAVNMFFSAVKLGILTWGVYGIDSLLQPASSGQSMNYSFNHFRVGFKRESGRLPLGLRTQIVVDVGVFHIGPFSWIISQTKKKITDIEQYNLVSQYICLCRRLRFPPVDAVLRVIWDVVLYVCVLKCTFFVSTAYKNIVLGFLACLLYTSSHSSF